IELEGRTKATLVVNAEPKAANIYIDDVWRGEGHWEGPVSPGKHTVEARLDGYETAKTLTGPLEPGETRLERLELAMPAPKFNGAYGGIEAMFAGAPSVTTGATIACQSITQLTCNSDGSSAIGAALPYRGGYSFGWLGIEGVGMLRYDQSW